MCLYGITPVNLFLETHAIFIIPNILTARERHSSPIALPSDLRLIFHQKINNSAFGSALSPDCKTGKCSSFIYNSVQAGEVLLGCGVAGGEFGCSGEIVAGGGIVFLFGVK